MKSLVAFILVFVNVFCFSQKETEKWYYPGSHIPNSAPAIDFSSGVPVYLNNNAIGAGTNESSATISDVNGNLLFYVDGNRNIYNRNHVVMTNGNNVFMGNSMTQGSVFVPKPGAPTIMYLFHIGLPTVGPAGPYNLYYTEIDMTLNGGLGGVNANKNILIAASTANCGEKMTVTKHCNGTDYWLLVHDFTGTTFKAYQISATGIAAPIISNIGTNYSINLPPGDDTYGQIKFSPNGTKLAAALFYSGTVEIFDFNKLTGVISNHLNLGTTGVNTYGVEFSPDNTKLYASDGDLSSKLMQWDLCAGNSTAIINSKQTFNVVGGRLHALQLAPDNKIYGTLFNNSNLSVINNPNIAGAGCNFVAQGFSVAPSVSYLGLPNFITSYFHKPHLFSPITQTQTNAICANNGTASVTICSAFGAAPYTYTWSTSFVDGPTNNVTSSISNLASGNYNVIITDATCMADTLFFVIVGQTAVFDTVNASVCSGSNYTLPGGNVVSVAGSYVDTLLTTSGCDSVITTNLSLVNTLSVSQNATICIGNSYTLPGGNIVTTAGTYIDTLLSVGGCDSIITTNLSVINSVSVSQADSICSGNSYTLPGGNIVTAGGTYIDTLQSFNGCDSIITTVLSVVNVLTSNQSVIICNGNSYTLPGGGIVNSQGVYNDTLSSSGGCDSIITTNLTVLQNSSSNANPIICSNESYTLPNGTTVNTSGTYNDTLTSANGCDSVITTTLTVNTSPTAGVSNNVTIIYGSTTTLTATGGGTYNWYPTNNLDNTNTSSVNATPLQTTTYCVEITSSNGCKDTSCVTVVVEIPCPKETDLKLPNAFSPNGDNVNDEFCLQGWDFCIEDFEILIYDRWGAKVFESKDSGFCWDGKYNGTIMDAAVFVYQIKAKFLNIDKTIKKSGNISLIR